MSSTPLRLRQVNLAVPTFRGIDFQVGRFPERAISAMGDFQVSGFQVRAFQDGDFRVGDFQVSNLQVGDFQVSSFQVRAFQVGESQVGNFQAEIIKIFTLKIEFAYPKPFKTRIYAL